VVKYAHRVLEEVYRKGTASFASLLDVFCKEFGLERRRASRLLAMMLRRFVARGLIVKVARGYYASPYALPAQSGSGCGGWPTPWSYTRTSAGGAKNGSTS